MVFGLESATTGFLGSESCDADGRIMKSPDRPARFISKRKKSKPHDKKPQTKIARQQQWQPKTNGIATLADAKRKNEEKKCLTKIKTPELPWGCTAAIDGKLLSRDDFEK